MPTVTRARLWIGLTTAPAAWLLGELVGYYVAARGCEIAHGIPLRAGSHPAGADLVVQAVALLTAGAGLYVAATNWRATRDPGGASGDAAAGRAHFMAMAGIVVSAVCTVGIVMFGFSSFVVNACSRAT